MSKTSFPFTSEEEKRDLQCYRLADAAWEFAYCALWPEQTISGPHQEACRRYIRQYLSASDDGRHAFISLVRRIVLARKYEIGFLGSKLPQPIVWFYRRYPFGFAGTLPLLHSVDMQRRKTPGHLEHITVLARNYFYYSLHPTRKQFSRCRKKLLAAGAPGLLQLFYHTIIHAKYIQTNE